MLQASRLERPLIDRIVNSNGFEAARVRLSTVAGMLFWFADDHRVGLG